MLVYAAQEGLVVWSDNNKGHKAGRVHFGEAMEVLTEKTDWYEVKRPLGLYMVEEGVEIPAPIQPNYPNHWVEKQYVAEGGTTPAEDDPEIEDVVDAVADAASRFMKWLDKRLAKGA